MGFDNEIAGLNPPQSWLGIRGIAHSVPPRLCLSYKSYDLMKPHSSIQVVRMWHRVCTDHVLRCFDNPEGLNYGNLLVGVVHELSS
jgi:hypothetical protein